MQTEPTEQHRWLDRLVGEWAFESECVMGPDQPPMTGKGTERVRKLGDLWIVCEGEGSVPGCDQMSSLMTLGYDPMKERFVGNWIGSPMAYLFVYEGELSADGGTLPLNTIGPSFDDPAKLAKYQDVIEMHPDGRRVLHSQLLKDDGSTMRFMTATYTRVT